MEQICESLDKVVLEIFEVLEELYRKKAELEQVMKDGYFSMARARYSMGVKRVTADQILDANLTAGKTLHVDDDCSDEKSEQGEDSPDEHSDKAETERIKNVFTLCGEDGSVNKPVASDEKEIKVGDSDTVIRKRGTAKTPLNEEDREWEEMKKIIEEEDKKIKSTNPINLFGVLVPQALRSSQKSFEDAVRISVDIANQQHKLKDLQVVLDSLQKKKAEFSQSSPSGGDGKE